MATGLIGKTLGQYRIVEQIGMGGMATVYKAYQPSLDRYVAIKVLPAYYVHEAGFHERFQREAKAVAKLDHPNILPVYDFGQEDDTTYIVMKYVEAGTLKDMMGRPMNPKTAVAVIDQVAGALDHAHQRDVIHRDVKPSNILMAEGNWALLTDFGLAKMVGGASQLTASGVGVGTPDYMSPEQGQGQRVDGRTDVYSLGVVLYEMATGRVPFRAETPMAVVIKHITEPLPLPHQVNPGIPESVERIILKALAKDPDDRFGRASELAQALSKAVAGSVRRPSAEAAAETPPLPVVEEAPPVAPSPAPSTLVAAPGAAPPVVEAPTKRVAPSPSPPTQIAVPGTAPPAVKVPARKRFPWGWAVAAVGLLALLAVAVVGTLLIMGPWGEGPSPGEYTPPEKTDLPAPVEPRGVGMVYDDFESDRFDTERWRIEGENTERNVRQRDGRLFFIFDTPAPRERGGTVAANAERPIGRAEAEVELLAQEGEFGAVGLGVAWDEEHLLIISVEGPEGAVVRSLVEGDREETELLQPGHGLPARHRLGLRLDGERAEILVDGQVVETLPVTGYPRHFGLNYYVGPEGRMDAAVDSVTVRFLPGEDSLPSRPMPGEAPAAFLVPRQLYADVPTEVEIVVTDEAFVVDGPSVRLLILPLGGERFHGSEDEVRELEGLVDGVEGRRAFINDEGIAILGARLFVENDGEGGWIGRFVLVPVPRMMVQVIRMEGERVVERIPVPMRVVEGEPPPGYPWAE